MQTLPEIGPTVTLVFPDKSTVEERSYFLALMSPTLAMLLERDGAPRINMNCSSSSWKRVKQCYKLLLESISEVERNSITTIHSLSVDEIMEDFETIIYYQMKRLYELYTKRLSLNYVSPTHIIHLMECGVNFQHYYYADKCYNEKYAEKLPAKQFYECYSIKNQSSFLRKWFISRAKDEVELIALYNCFKQSPIYDMEFLLSLVTYAPASIREDLTKIIKVWYETLPATCTSSSYSSRRYEELCVSK